MPSASSSRSYGLVMQRCLVAKLYQNVFSWSSWGVCSASAGRLESYSERSCGGEKSTKTSPQTCRARRSRTRVTAFLSRVLFTEKKLSRALFRFLRSWIACPQPPAWDAPPESWRAFRRKTAPQDTLSATLSTDANPMSPNRRPIFGSVGRKSKIARAIFSPRALFLPEVCQATL